MSMPADREESVETLLKLMETHGVERAVLVQIGGTSREHHAYLRHCLRSYPDRFKGIGLVPDPRRPEEHMDRLAEDGGIVGYRLFRIGGPPEPLAPVDVRAFATYPVWKHAAQKGYVIWLYPRASEAHRCARLLDAFPDLTVVFNHLMVCPADGSMTADERGRPRLAGRALPDDAPLARHDMRSLARYPNVCVKLSGQYAFSDEPYRTGTCGAGTRRWCGRSAPTAACGRPTFRGYGRTPATASSPACSTSCCRSSTTPTARGSWAERRGA